MPGTVYMQGRSGVAGGIIMQLSDSAWHFWVFENIKR